MHEQQGWRFSINGRLFKDLLYWSGRRFYGMRWDQQTRSYNFGWRWEPSVA